MQKLRRIPSPHSFSIDEYLSIVKKTDKKGIKKLKRLFLLPGSMATDDNDVDDDDDADDDVDEGVDARTRLPANQSPSMSLLQREERFLLPSLAQEDVVQSQPVVSKLSAVVEKRLGGGRSAEAKRGGVRSFVPIAPKPSPRLMPVGVAIPTVGGKGRKRTQEEINAQEEERRLKRQRDEWEWWTQGDGHDDSSSSRS